MANKNFVVKNGLTVNTNFVVNSTSFNYANVVTYNSNNLYLTTGNNLSLTTGNNSILFNNGNGVTLNFTNTLITTSNLTILSPQLNISANAFSMNSSSVTIKAGLNANNSLGSNGQVLASNGSVPYWAAPQTITSGMSTYDTSSNSNTFYIPFATNANGVWSNAVFSSTKLYFVPSTGTLSATELNSLSDKTLKTNIKNVENALDLIRNIDGVKFEWKENGISSYGVIAQNVEQYLPELVSSSKSGVKSVNYNGFVSLLLESIKILEKRIIDLESKN